VNAGAILTIPPGFPLAASGSVAVNGAIAGGGMLSMVGSANCNLGASTIGASLQIAKTGTAQVQVVGSVSVTGNLTPANADATISGAAFDEVGRAVAPAGDLNGDGFADVVLGTDAAGGSSQGQAFVFLGPLSGFRTAASR